VPLSNAAGEYSSRAAEAHPFATGRVRFSKPHSMAAVGQFFFLQHQVRTRVSLKVGWVNIVDVVVSEQCTFGV
jgi:hypothetical protein